MKTIKILNLYACLGGNRYKRDEVAEQAEVKIEVTAVATNCQNFTNTKRLLNYD